MGITTHAVPGEQSCDIVSQREHSGTDIEDQDVTLLLETVENRIQDEVYWEKCMGVEHVDEARNVYNVMVKQTGQIRRILVARKYDIDKSTEMFLSQVRFRAKWKPLEITPFSIPNALPSGVLRLCGYSRHECVLCNFKFGSWDPDAYGANGEDSEKNFDDAIAEFVRYVCYFIELMIASMKPSPVPEQFDVIVDLSGFYMSLALKSNARAMIARMIYIAQEQYPERLHRAYLVNSPYGFSTAWKMVRPLLDEKTVSKIHFVETASLADHIDPAVLSTEYGGLHPEYPIPSKVLKEESSVHE